MSTEAQSGSSGPSYLVWGLILVAAVVGLVLWTLRGKLAGEAPRLVPETQVLKLYGEPRQIAPPPTQGERVRKLRVQLQRTKERLMQAVDRADPRVTRDAEGTLLTDVRDGYMAAHMTQFELDLPQDVSGTLRVDVALLYNDALEAQGIALPDGLAMKLSIGLVDGDETPTPIASQSLVADPDVLGWTPVRCTLSTFAMERPRLVFQSVLVGAPPEAITVEVVKNVSACWANAMLVRERSDPARTPNVIVLSIDTLRADHLGCYGYERETSPNLDALVARGALFEEAVSAAPWTLPSYGSLFTGRYPSAHRAGVKPYLQNLWTSPACGDPVPVSGIPQAVQTRQLAPRCVTLAEALRDQGYRTAGLVNNPFLHPSRGVDHGFERYAWYQYTADDGVDEALDWIDGQEGVPFFLFLHLMDPHMPYAPPAPYDEKFSGQKLTEVDPAYPWTLGHVRADPAPERWRQLLIDMYDGEIAYADEQVGRFVAELERRGLMDDTILVFHSDHGEEFWDHGTFEHGHTLHRELLHVPLAIVYERRIPAGTRVAARVRTVDVLPTVLELLGLEPDVAELDRGRLRADGASLNARSLLPWIVGSREDDLDTLSEAMLYGPPEARWHEQKARCEGDLKLILGGQLPSAELYDVASDPGETKNVIMDRWEETRGMVDRLVNTALTLAQESAPSDVMKNSAELLKAMEGVGYTGQAEDEQPGAGADEGRPESDASER